MADLPKFGMDAELAAKEAAKFNPADERLVSDWIADVTGRSKGSQDFMEWLKDGTVLVELINKLSNGKAGLKANVSTMPFKQMENIANFLSACRKTINMRENDLFTSADLYDGKSRVNVINGLIATSRAASKNGYAGPSIAPKESSGKSQGEFKHQLGAADAGISKLSMGSAGVMEKPHMGGFMDPTFGNKASGSGSDTGVSKMSMGSAGVMERSEVSKANNINFGHQSAGGAGDTSSASKLSMGSAGVMERAEISKAKDINFGAKAGSS